MKRKDIDKILAARLITPAQREAIVEHFRLNEKMSSRWLLVSLSVLAAGLIVAGIVMLVSANWYSIPPLVKLGAAALLLVAFWAGWAWQREARPIVSEVLGFCGAGMWLGCISLYGQIFQLQNPFVEGCTLFFAGIVLIPFICRQRFLIWAVVLCSFVELAALGDGSSSYLNFENCIPGWKEDYLVSAMFLLGAIWWAQAERWGASTERRRSYGVLAPVLLLVMVSVSQMMMYESLPVRDLDIVHSVLMALVPVVLLVLKPRSVRWLPWCGMSAVISLFLPGFFVPDLLQGRAEHVAGILIYFLLALLTMFCGVRALRMSWINLGALMVVYAAIALMANVLDSYTFSGLVLVVAGLLMLGLGVLLEKSRRRLILSVKNSHPSTPEA